jgi:hypothetical protein
MRTLLMGCLMALLLGCAGPQVSDYANEQPRLELSDYFKGDMRPGGCSRTAPAKWSNASMWP